jgi:hypothetical protein
MPIDDERISVPLIELRPTQISVGMLEVERKRHKWRALSKRERKDRLDRPLFPAIRGPNDRLYLIDRHHLGRALADEGIAAACVRVVRDLSWLRPERFWPVMEWYGWVYPFDHRGRRRGFHELPPVLTRLRDDPYRSLAGRLRVAGGFAKVETPYAEFAWAAFLRRMIDEESLRRAPASSLRLALKLAKSTEARDLPGWKGREVARLAG